VQNKNFYKIAFAIPLVTFAVGIFIYWGDWIGFISNTLEFFMLVSAMGAVYAVFLALRSLNKPRMARAGLYLIGVEHLLLLVSFELVRSQVLGLYDWSGVLLTPFWLLAGLAVIIGWILLRIAKKREIMGGTQSSEINKKSKIFVWVVIATTLLLFLMWFFFSGF